MNPSKFSKSGPGEPGVPHTLAPSVERSSWPASVLSLYAMFVSGLALSLAGCAPTEPPPAGPLRLVERLAEAEVVGSPPPVEPAAPVMWSFSELEDLSGVRSITGVGELSLEGGALVLTTTDDFPVLALELPGLEEGVAAEPIHSVEVRLRVSEGGTLSLRTGDELPEGPREKIQGPFPWSLETPVVAGEESQLYTLRGGRTLTLEDERWLVLRPVDVAGAEVAIESLRVIRRREHLLSVPTGVGWHGMGEIYRESVVSRSGEALRFPLHLPENPWLDLAVATLGDEAVTFRARLWGDSEEDAELLFETSVEKVESWQPLEADLAAHAGRRVTLELSAESPSEEALAFWGTPVVRSRVASTEATDEGPQGVIVIVTDTLRRDRLPFYGHERDTAPVLGQMVSEGALAVDALSQSTWTKLSVTSIFTSLYPTSHTVRRFSDRLPASADTLAELFLRQGYATLGLSSISFTGRFTNMHQGYEEFHESASLPEKLNAKTARHHVDRLLPWLERHRDGRFFVFLHVADPHSPYEPYEPWSDFYGEPGDLEDYVEQRETVRPHIDNPLMQRFGMPRREDVEEAGLDPEHYVALEYDAYDASIRAMDEEIGRVIATLEELGLDDDVVVAVVSDHGTELLDHDDHFHGHTVYGELNQVPMFFWGPGTVPAGVRIEPTVETLDLMPTVLDLAGIAAPDNLQGQSLVPLMGEGVTSTAGARYRPRPAVTETERTPPRALPSEAGDCFALAVDDWKLVRCEPEMGEPTNELYHRPDDPYDQNDLAAEQPQKVAELLEQLEGWRQQAEANRLQSDDELAEGMSAEELERLRSLGYVQ